MNKTLLKTALVAAVVVWAANNVDPVKKLIGENEGGWFG